MGKGRGLHEEDGNGAFGRREGPETGKSRRARKRVLETHPITKKSLVGHQGVLDSLWETWGRMNGVPRGTEQGGEVGMCVEEEAGDEGMEARTAGTLDVEEETGWEPTIPIRVAMGGGRGRQEKGRYFVLILKIKHNLENRVRII